MHLNVIAYGLILFKKNVIKINDYILFYKNYVYNYNCKICNKIY